MRDFIFVIIILSMLGLGVWHGSTGAWTSLSIDLFLIFFAWRSWNPRASLARYLRR
jgi:hypothetical protein